MLVEKKNIRMFRFATGMCVVGQVLSVDAHQWVIQDPMGFMVQPARDPRQGAQLSFTPMAEFAADPQAFVEVLKSQVLFSYIPSATITDAFEEVLVNLRQARSGIILPADKLAVVPRPN